MMLATHTFTFYLDGGGLFVMFLLGVVVGLGMSRVLEWMVDLDDAVRRRRHGGG